MSKHSDSKNLDDTGNGRDIGYRSPQSQGGVSHEVAERARKDPHPERAGMPHGTPGPRPDLPSPSMGARDDNATSGLTGDDGGYIGADTQATPDSIGPGQPVPPAGGVGGQSGTGQARPHHGPGELEQRGNPPDQTVGEHPAGTTTSDGNSQSGGTKADRAQRVKDRKSGESSHGTPGGKTGRADPAPGAPVRRER
jgi:hypothetical protein